MNHRLHAAPKRLGSAFAWALTTLLALLLVSQTATAETIQIRKIDVQGDKLVVYHTPVEVEGQSTEVAWSPSGGCDDTVGPLELPQEDPISLLIVIDRGGTKTGGMGLHSAKIIRGVRSFLENQKAAGRDDQIALFDSSGKTGDPDEYPLRVVSPTTFAFLDGLPSPSGMGADIYGNAADALSLLEKTPGPLSFVVIITDGIDPKAIAGDNSAVKRLIDEANRMEIPLFGISVNRSEDPVAPGDLTAEERQRKGRDQLADVVQKTGGKVRKASADENLAASIDDRLSALMAMAREVERTDCTLCGNAQSAEATGISMRIRDAAGNDVATTSSPFPFDRARIAALKLDECAVAAPAGDAASTEDGGSPEADDSKRNILVGIAIAVAVLLALFAVMRSRRKPEPDPEPEPDLAPIAPADPAAITPTPTLPMTKDDSGEPPRRAPAPVPPPPPPPPFTLRPAMVDSGQEIPLRFGSTVVGADPSCDVPLDAPSISGRHAQFDVTEEGVVTVTDLESSNGTYVGDVRIKANTPTELRAGDELALSKRLRVVLIARDLNA